jgi:hypothetical protein
MSGLANLTPALYRDYLVQVGFGQIPGHIRAVALGRAIAVAAAPADVWNGQGTALYPWLTVATALELVSSSAQDGPAGTGAASVTVVGLNAAYVQVTQTVALNGVGAVALPTPLFRINSIFIASKGAAAVTFGATNVGLITLRDAGAGTARGFISVGIGISQQTVFTVPAGKTLQVDSQFGCVDQPSAAKDFTFNTYIQSPAGIFRLPGSFSVDGTPFSLPGLPGIILAEKMDFCYRITAVSGAGNSYTVSWLGVLKDNGVY